MSVSGYASEYPDTPVNPGIQTFFETFYKTSDTPDAHDRYADSFTKDAVLIMASKKATGRSEILALRKGMWEHVASRQHTPVKVFPFGANADEVMLYGTVAYGLKSGKSNVVDWAARAHLVEEDATMKMDFYQVYLDTAEQSTSR